MATSDASSPEPIKLDAIQREALLPEIERMLAAAIPADSRALYQRLKECVDSSIEVPAELSPYLGVMIDSAILSGNAKRFGAGVQQSLVALFQKTLQGKQIADSIRAINAALEKVKGHVVEQASTSLRAPGSYSLTLKTDQMVLVVVFDRAGI